MKNYNYTYKPESKSVISFFGYLLLIGAGIVLILAIAGGLGYTFDKAYERRCNVWHDCDQTAIDHFKSEHCEILGDANGNRWGECKPGEYYYTP